MTAASSAPEADFPLATADLCVKCGLCLPHCPTYALQRHEADSPRGRIALLQGLVVGSIPMSERLEQHLDGCLSCRACESACPAKVPFSLLMDEGRAVLQARRPARGRFVRALAWALTQRSVARLMLGVLWLYQVLGVQALLRRTRLLGRGRLARLESLLPPLSPIPFSAQPRPEGRGTVALFTGCVSDLADRETLQAADRLLQRLGIHALVPAQQTCCGALYQHAGLKASAGQCTQRNAEAFAQAATVLGTASGCTATLLDAPQLLPGPAGQALRAKVQDIHAYLAKHWPEDLRLRPLAARVAVHSPCTLRNVVKQEGAVLALLRKIPHLELVELDRSSACCGAAGSHFLTDPDTADRLLAPKLAAAQQLQPQLIVSTNVGCSLHLAAGLRRTGRAAPEVLHPLVLLARQLPK